MVFLSTMERYSTKNAMYRGTKVDVSQSNRSSSEPQETAELWQKRIIRAVLQPTSQKVSTSTMKGCKNA